MSRFALALLVCASATALSTDGLQKILQEVADMESAKYDCAIGIGLKTASDKYSIVSGNSDETVGHAVKVSGL
jgi:hypothetical protein